MTNATIEAGTLTASIQDRVVSGLLLPYGEIGRTNLGKFSIDGPGIIEIPNDVSVLMANADHSQVQPRARFLTATDTPGGIVASFKVGENPEGDVLLASVEKSIKNGKPMSLSVELTNVIIRAGKALGGKLTGAAFVENGAFPSASVMAADAGEFPGEPSDSSALSPVDGVLSVEATSIPDSVEVTADSVTTTFTPKPESEPLMASATIPKTLNPVGASVGGPAPLTKGQVFATLHAIQSGTATEEDINRLKEASGGSNLFAALTDIKYDGAGGVGVNMSPSQWIGELWSGKTYEQQIATLFNHGDLSSLTINGFRWTTKPTGGTWAGNKSNVPSSTAATTPFSTTAKRWAGAHDHAREHRDFNTPGYFESYYAAMTDSYLQWVDETITLADVLAAATSVRADNPAGLTIGAGLSAIIDGAAEVIAAKAVPSFALVSTQLWKQIAKTPQNATLGYLNAALNLEEGSLDGFKIRASSLVAAGNVLVGAKEAVTVYELPGVPLRVEAADLVKGGIDTGLFGYAGTVVHKANALQLVTPYTP